MAALDFPSSPSVNDVYTANGKSWTWDGTSWISAGGEATAIPYWVQKSPWNIPSSPHAKNEEWNDAAGMSGTVNGLDSSWTTFGAAQTRTYVNGRLVLTGTAAGGTTPNLTGIYKSRSAGAYTLTVPVVCANINNYNMVAVGYRESSSGKLYHLALAQQPQAASDYSGTFLTVGRYASPTSRTSSSLDYTIRVRKIWIRAVDNGSTTISLQVSFTGREGTYVNLITDTYGSCGFSGAPDQFFIGLDPFSTSAPTAEFGPVRVT